MEKISWTNFAFKSDLYARMSKFLPFSLIEMRRGYITFVCSNSSIKFDQLSMLTNHKNMKNALIYIEKLLQQTLS